jgi:hypothetical protein
MKRLFKFFTVAAIIAVGFTGCSSETPIDPNVGPDPINPIEDEGETTYATFKFSVSNGAQTRAVGLDHANGEKVLGAEIVSEYRLFVFRADNTLEIDTFSTNGAQLTVPLISGVKKIFVLVNGGDDVAVLGTPEKQRDPGVSSPTYFNLYSQFNNLFDLATGSPLEFTDANKALLYGTNGDKFIYTNNVKKSYPLLPGISAGDSQTAGNQNNIEIEVERLVAKVAVTKTVPSQPEGVTPISGVIITKDSTGRIVPASVQYRLWNINKAVYPFQNYDASGVLVTPYGNNAPTFENYYLRAKGDGTGNNYITIATRSGDPAGTAYRFITENVPSTPYGGNTTYAEVEAVYLPTVGNYISTTIVYNESSESFAPVPASADLASATDIYQFREDGVTGLPVGALIAGTNALDLARKVTYHRLNPSVSEVVGASQYASVTNDQIKVYFDIFTAGKTYYRLNLGEQSIEGADINYGVKRNYYYDAEITGFLTLGANDPAKLLDETVVLQGKTNLTIKMTIRAWVPSLIKLDV